jgi:hypothetical protein
MTAIAVDAVLERYGPPPTLSLPAWLVEGRRTLTDAADRVVGIDERELARRWLWREDREGGAEVRYAFYRSVEALERATGLADGLVTASGARPTGAAPFAHATAARWDLHGLLAPLADDGLDADPGGGEWTIRQTLAHIVHVQRAYPAYSGWWLTREPTAELPMRIPESVDEGFPEEDADGIGSLVDIRRRLDEAMDGAMERMAALDEAQLATPARWSGFAVDVGFRLGRMSSHLQEHTVQVEKTLVMLRRTPPEAHRLLRLVLRAYGRAEATVYALPEHMAEAAREPLLAAIGEAADAFDHVRRPGSVTDSA